EVDQEHRAQEHGFHSGARIGWEDDAERVGVGERLLGEATPLLHDPADDLPATPDLESPRVGGWTEELELLTPVGVRDVVDPTKPRVPPLHGAERAALCVAHLDLVEEPANRPVHPQYGAPVE